MSHAPREHGDRIRCPFFCNPGRKVQVRVFRLQPAAKRDMCPSWPWRYIPAVARSAACRRIVHPDCSFDAAGINFGMFHFPHHEQALVAALLVPRHGGRIAFTVSASRDKSIALDKTARYNTRRSLAFACATSSAAVPRGIPFARSTNAEGRPRNPADEPPRTVASIVRERRETRAGWRDAAAAPPGNWRGACC